MRSKKSSCMLSRSSRALWIWWWRNRQATGGLTFEKFLALLHVQDNWLPKAAAAITERMGRYAASEVKVRGAGCRCARGFCRWQVLSTRPMISLLYMHP